VCLALAAFALGSQWTTLEKPPESQGGAIIQPDFGDPGKILYNHAKTLVPDIIDRPNLVTVQAIYLLGVYLMPANAISSSYVYLGLALRIALAINLHMDNSDDATLSATEKEVRRRLWWSIYSLERTTTLKLNRPRSISAEIISAPLPSPCPSFDKVQVFDNHLQQIFYAKLALIIDRVAESSSLSVGPPVQSTGTETPRHWVETVEAELKSWKRSLPSYFALELIDPRDSRYRAVFHLHLQYYYAWIAVGKVCVVAVVREHLRHHIAKEISPLYRDQSVPSLARHCIKAAKKLLRLFENITKTNNLTRFSFTDFQGCSISTIIVLLAGITKRDPEYDAQVNFGLESLRKMADGNKSAKTGVRFVEMLRSIADEAVAKLRQTVDQSHVQWGIDTADSESRYNQWAEWLARADRSQQPNSHHDNSHAMIDPSPAPRVDSAFTPVQEPSLAAHDIGYHWQMRVFHSSVDNSILSPSILGSDTPIAPRSRPRAKESHAGLVYMPDGTGHETHRQSLHAQQSGLEATNASLQWLHGDDQTFLTCLTGFDMLDFADLTWPVDSADV
jgi:Fungal specific transcription factor domain